MPGGGGGLFLASYVFVLVSFSLLVINSYLSKKKKILKSRRAKISLLLRNLSHAPTCNIKKKQKKNN